MKKVYLFLKICANVLGVLCGIAITMGSVWIFWIEGSDEAPLFISISVPLIGLVFLWIMYKFTIKNYQAFKNLN